MEQLSAEICDALIRTAAPGWRDLRRRIVVIPCLLSWPLFLAAEPSFVSADPTPPASLVPVWQARSDVGWAGGLAAALGTGAVAGYLLHRDRRKRFEASLEGRLRFEKLISELSIAFINVPANKVDQAVNDALEQVRKAMHLDQCFLFEYRIETEELLVTHQATAVPGLDSTSVLDASQFPWYFSELRAGRILQHEDMLRDLPESAIRERAYAEEHGIKSALAIPLRNSEIQVLGICYYSLEQPREWTGDLSSSLQLVGDVLLSSLTVKKAETALRQTETSMNLAAESALLGFWRWYPDENRSWLTEQARAIYGFDEDTRGNHADYMKRIHPEDRAAAMARFKEAIAGEDAFEHEYRLVFPGNEIRWVVVRARLVRKPNGRLQEIVGVSIDVTRNRKQELQLRQQQEEMARLGRVAMMGEMTASLAHELNQPLTAIVSNASAARRFISQGPTDQALMNELLQDITTAGQRAGEIIRGIRSMVRPGVTGRERLDINATVREVLKLMRTDILGRESSVETDLAPTLPSVNAVPVQIQQVLLNLIMNGLEAMRHLPTNTRRLMISTSAAVSGTVAIVVRDHGNGLPPDVSATKMFEQFYSTKKDGMGMGLAISRSIIEAHGGYLQAANHPDGGAKFTISLPTGPVPPPAENLP